MLIDSNIIIYAAKPEYGALRRFIAEKEPAVSAISYVEVLGYHQLTEQERQHFEAFFGFAGSAVVSGRAGASSEATSTQKNDLRRCAGSWHSPVMQSYPGHTEHRRFQGQFGYIHHCSPISFSRSISFSISAIPVIANSQSK